MDNVGVVMYQKFFNASNEKQDRIISATVKEFALYGYEGASTNRIVTEAGISKGILFHYFGNKQNLFDFIAEYCALVLIEDYHEKLKNEETNFFTRLNQLLHLRFQITELFPHVFMFRDRITDEGGEHAEGFLKLLEGYNFYEPFKRCDRSDFNRGIDFEELTRYTEWVVEGFIKHCEGLDAKAREKETEKFISNLRRIFTGK